MSGRDFFTLQRRIFAPDSWLWDMPSDQTKVAVTLIGMANWKEGKKFYGGQLVTVARGQVMTSLDAIAAASRVSKQTVRTTLRNLEKAEFLTCKSTNKFRIITILNYSREQDRELAEEHARQQATGTQLTGNQQATGTQLTPIEPGNQGTREPGNQKEGPAEPVAQPPLTLEPGPTPAPDAADKPPGWGTLSVANRKTLAKHLDEVSKLWALQTQLRQGRPLKPTADRLLRIADRLEAGATVEECELVLHQYAREARRNPKSAQWFNGESNWRKDNFDRTLGFAAVAPTNDRQPGLGSILGES